MTDLEQRLRTTFLAVADLPGPAPTTTGQTSCPSAGRRPSGLLIAAVSVAALALVVAVALTFGPHSSAPGGGHGRGTAPASHPTSTTSTTSTEQLTYRPFNGATLKADLHVTGHQSGTCSLDDDVAQGQSHYRCGTMEPCVAGSQGTNAPLACPVEADPTNHDVILWTVTSLEPIVTPAHSTHIPFALQLPNGVVCVLVNAAWSGLGPYGCGGQTGSTPADCRQPKAGRSYWTTKCQNQLTQSSPFTSANVTKVWF
jgi:hypothetical protein